MYASFCFEVKPLCVNSFIVCSFPTWTCSHIPRQTRAHAASYFPQVCAAFAIVEGSLTTGSTVVFSYDTLKRTLSTEQQHHRDAPQPPALLEKGKRINNLACDFPPKITLFILQIRFLPPFSKFLWEPSLRRALVNVFLENVDQRKRFGQLFNLPVRYFGPCLFRGTFFSTTSTLPNRLSTKLSQHPLHTV